MGDLLPLTPNHRTAKRQRSLKEREKERLINRIGVRMEDAPLFEEEIRFLAYAQSKGEVI